MKFVDNKLSNCREWEIFPIVRIPPLDGNLQIAGRETAANKKSSPMDCFLEWELTDSNRRPSACKADALNQLS